MFQRLQYRVARVFTEGSPGSYEPGILKVTRSMYSDGIMTGGPCLYVWRPRRGSTGIGGKPCCFSGLLSSLNGEARVCAVWYQELATSSSGLLKRDSVELFKADRSERISWYCTSIE